MFGNYLALLKILFVQQFRVKDSGRKNTNGKNKRTLSSTAITYIILAIVFVPIMISVAFGVFFVGKVQGRESADVTITLLLLMCQVLVTFFGVPSVIANVFASKDGDKLLYLPMRASTIFAAKLSVVYINEAITSAVTILFVLLPFGIGAGLGASFYLLLPFALILLPILPLTLASIVAIPFAFLLRRFSNSSVLKVILQLVLFVSFMGVYLYAINRLTSVSTDNPEQSTDFVQLIAETIRQVVANSQHIVKWILPDSMLAVAMATDNFGTAILNLLGSVGLNASLFGVVVLISVPMYKSSLIGNLENAGRRKRFNASELKQTGKSKSLLSQLMLCDFKRTMRDSQLGFQMLINVIMMPLIIIIMAVVFKQTSDGAFDAYKNSQTYQAIVALVMVGYLGTLAGSTNGWGLYAISRERQSFYLLKTLPISVKQLLLSKILLSTIVLTVTSIVAVVVAIFMFNLYWYWAIACVVSMILLQFATTCITTYLDIRKPVLNWTNFKQGLSNSVKSWIAVLIAYIEILIVGVFGSGFVVLYTFVPNIFVIIGMWLLLILLSSLLAFFAFRFVVSKGEKLLDNVES